MVGQETQPRANFNIYAILLLAGAQKKANGQRISYLEF